MGKRNSGPAAAKPASWSEVLWVGAAVALTMTAVTDRGWVFGMCAALIFVVVSIPPWINRPATMAWSTAHPNLAAVPPGLLVFAVIGSIAQGSLWWVLVAGLLGAVSARLAFAVRARRPTTSPTTN